MYVNVKFSRNSVLLELEPGALENVKKDHLDFERKLGFYQNEILKRKLTFPLDYIMNLPTEYRDNLISQEEQEGIWRRENIFKNVVMRRLLEIRREKKKPKLK